MPYPHGPNCACPPLPHDAGLLRYTLDCDHHQQLTQALARLAEPEPQTATLRILTTDPTPDNLIPLDKPECSGSMTCDCPPCASERAARVRQGVRPSQPVPIKRRAAA